MKGIPRELFSTTHFYVSGIYVRFEIEIIEICVFYYNIYISYIFLFIYSVLRPFDLKCRFPLK